MSRERFEVWAKNQGLSLTRNGKYYFHGPTQGAWSGWQAYENVIISNIVSYFLKRSKENERRAAAIPVGKDEFDRGWHSAKADTYQRCADLLIKNLLDPPETFPTEAAPEPAVQGATVMICGNCARGECQAEPSCTNVDCACPTCKGFPKRYFPGSMAERAADLQAQVARLKS